MDTKGDRIKQLRKENGLNQAELGKLVGAAKTTVSGWERNERIPEPETLSKLADVFNVSMDYLYCKTDLRSLRLLTDEEIKDIIPELKHKVNLNIAVEGAAIDERTKRELRKLLTEKGYL